MSQTRGAVRVLTVLAFAGFAVFAKPGITADTKAEKSSTGQISTKKSTATKSLGDPLKRLSRSYDKMGEVAWYSHPTSSPLSYNMMYLYFGKNDDGTFTSLRLRVGYFADSWLSVKSAWAKADGENVNIPQVGSAWKKYTYGGSAREILDVEVTQARDIATVRTMANAKSVTIRFEGRDGHSDRTPDAGRLKAMREVLSVYEAVTGKATK